MAAETKAHGGKQPVGGESASPREENRWYKAVVNTGTGTPSSMAALIVQRPSPESETLPPNFESCASAASAVAVRSSNHEAITLPRRHTSGNISQGKVVLIVLRIASEGRSLGIHVTLTLPRVSAFQNADTFGVSGHDSGTRCRCGSFDEVTSAARSTVQVTLFRGATIFLTARSARYIANAGRKRDKDRIQTLDYFLFTADHHAIATLKAPDAAAGSDIEIVNT